MDLIKSFVEQAKQRPLRIVYPESHDERVLRAASQVGLEGIAQPVIVGKLEKTEAAAALAGVDLGGIEWADNSDDMTLERYADAYASARDVKIGIGRKLVRKPLSFAGMMVKLGDASGMVAGVDTATGHVIQAASLTIGFQAGLSTSSSFFIMVLPSFMDETNKALVFADAAVAVAPDSQQLAEIAVASGRNARDLLGMDPKIAFLSFSTKGSAVNEQTHKVVAAVEIARQIDASLDYDGELQADAALVPRVAAKKVQESSVAGKANVLIFPDLSSGNIAYKLVQYLAGAQAIGPILQGFAKPVNDMSRGATVGDIVKVSAITVVQAQKAETVGAEAA
ncbi:MAG: phosphate acetyltransferase [Armatimonadetes bacterium CG2_30_59_28]|nr:phosphotransacetylase [Armatimonadota bacterium]OIO89448.1 MAG: phosphate acetyltransferase [Armatimonadetes bacterium CG2_30_59_28]PIU64905.1 MAG: phosphate acetyltransferase [Armatimonadetes bacterium CG07_land_8_20_14_0_80_59_28]PIX41938.1 MAG: phosphate acetyltransferase [Armatimonadetes bacterium CG_4_8_14_3_um_filter_58_9]PIY39910.1 MAG: phosphate acetyltransferase [Armatimonadetes bacterium CG_4_10_14_3_um_filter_59_10]PJB69162.1 MAG: phosphate acetyltransferase [Armatimonadetes bact